MPDQGITLDFSKAQPLQPIQAEPAQQSQPSAQPTPQTQTGDLQKPQRFPNATGASEGPDGQIYWHDIQNKQLGPFTQDELSLVNQPQKYALKQTGVTLDFSKAQPLQAASQQQPAPEKPGLIHRLWDKVNTGLISPNAISTALTGMSSDELNAALKADPNIQGKTIHIPGFGDVDLTEFTRGVFHSTAGVVSNFTSPASIALMAASPLMNAGRAVQAVRAAKAAQTADSAFQAADAVHAARATEIVTATQQAADAQKAVEAAEAAEQAGTGTRAATIAAQNTASEAAANAMKAQKALKLAEEARALNAVEAAKANRASIQAIQAAKAAGAVGQLPEVVGTAAKGLGRAAAVGFTAQGAATALTPQQPGETLADEIERRAGGAGWALLGAEGLRGTPVDTNLSELPNTVKGGAKDIGEGFKNWYDARSAAKADGKTIAAREEAHADLMTAIPPTKAAPYSYEDMEIGRNYLEHYHNNVEKITNTEQLRDAFEAEREGIENKVTGLIQRYATEPILTNPKIDVFDALAEQDKIVPGFRAEAMKALNRYNITDINMGEADALRRQLNSENRAVLKKNNWGISDALSTDPDFAARYHLVDSLRKGEYNQLENKKVTGAREMRSDETSLIRLRNAADRQIFNGEKTVRGSNEVGAFRKGAAKVSTVAGTAAGAAAGYASGIPLGGEAGAVIGAGIGKRAGEFIAPPDITRNELIQRSLENNVAAGTPKELKGKGTAGTPLATETIDKQQIRPENTRENSPLHSALATHYDETIGDTPYQDLEKRFLDDVKIKKQHKVPLDNSEKSILKGINEAKTKEILDARREIEKQAKEAAAKASERSNLEKETTYYRVPSGFKPSGTAADVVRYETEELGNNLNISPEKLKELEKYPASSLTWVTKTPEEAARYGGPEEHKVFGNHEIIAEDGDGGYLLFQKPENRSNLEGEPRVIDSNVAKANQPRLETAEEESRMPYGFDRDKFHNHEWGHVAVAAAEGIPAKDFISTEHPEAVNSRMVGGIGWSERPYVSDPKAEEKYTPQEIWNNTKKWLSVYMGGAAANELLDGIKFEKNRGLMADRRNARLIMQAHGLDAADAEIMMIDAFRRATEHLTKPGVLDTIRENAKFREENLPETLHASPGRLEKFQDYIRGLQNERNNPNTKANAGARSSGGATEGNEPEAARSRPAGSPEGREETSTGAAPNAKKLIEDAGLIYKGELTKGSGVHLMEHPSYPGKTSAISEAQLTPEAIHAKMGKTLNAFDANVALEGESIADAADRYNKSQGRPEIDAEPKPHSPEFAKQLADAYDEMKHEPDNPKVQKSYGALKNDVRRQWDYAVNDLGMKFEPWTKQGQPYANSKEMMKDVNDNHHLYFFQGGDIPADHPLAETNKDTGYSYNDMFRAVHDLFGHVANGFQFGPKGEENAYLVHRQMFSPEAIPALTNETRAQNSWINFGKHLRNEQGEVPQKGQEGYVAPENRPYAENKAGQLPEEFYGPLTSEQLHDKEAKDEDAYDSYHPVLKNIVDNYGADDNPEGIKGGASFITPDGRYVFLGPEEHPQVLKNAGWSSTGKDNRVSFIQETGVLRTRFRIGRQGGVLTVTVPGTGVTPDQISAIQKAVGYIGRNGNLVLERADISTATKDKFSNIKEFARPSDVVPMLKNIGVIPDRISALEGEDWPAVVAERMKSEPAGGIDPKTGQSDTEGYGVEIYPEARKTLDHQPTAKDIQKYYDVNKEFLDKHPELRIGWSHEPKGWELNIGAVTDNKKGAQFVGRELDQRAAFDIGKQEEIPTGGSGGKTKFGRYSLEDRLADLKTSPVEKLPKNVRESEFLTDEEKHILASEPSSLKNFKQMQDRIASAPDLAATMKAGQANRFWYDRARKSFDAMFDSLPKNEYLPVDKERFPALVAATSPQVDPSINLRQALDAYHAWVDAGRPIETDDIRKVTDSILKLNAYQANTARALRGEPLSGPKVSSFSRNLSEGGEQNVTNDLWGAVTNGIVDAKELSNPGKYIALSHNYRQAAKSLGWAPEQGQAASWGFVRSLAYASGWKGSMSDFRPPEEVVKLIDDPMVRKYSADIAEIFLTDEEVRDRLSALGVDLEKFDDNLQDSIKEFGRGGEGKAKGVNPKALARTASNVKQAKQYAQQQREAGKRIGGKMEEAMRQGGLYSLSGKEK